MAIITITEHGSLYVAFQRIGRGILGTWCVVGPMLLVYAIGEFELGLCLFVFAMVAVCYIIAIMKWRRQGTAFIWATVIDALLTFLFAGLGGVFGGLVSAFGGPALHKMGTLTMLYVVAGFWILEARKRRTVVKSVAH